MPDIHASQKSWFYLLNKYFVFFGQKKRRTIFIKRLMSRRRIGAGPIRRRVNTRGYLGKPFTVSPPNVIKSRWLLRAKKSYLFIQNEKKKNAEEIKCRCRKPVGELLNGCAENIYSNRNHNFPNGTSSSQTCSFIFMFIFFVRVSTMYNFGGRISLAQINPSER